MGVNAVRSIETIVAILAVAKAGGAYVPIDPELPEARRRGMIARCGIEILLHVGAAPGLARTEIAVDAPIEDAPAFTDDAHADHPLVILHTSGTTGEPKAVVLAQRGIVAYVEQLARTWAVGPDDRIVQFASLSFDASLEDIGLAWTTGARLLLRTEDMLAPDVLLDVCAKKAVTLLDVPTAYLPLLASAATKRGGWPASLRLIIIGGERLQPAWLETYLRDARAPRLVSMYGPTEASISVAAYEARAVTSGAPLGFALPGCEIRVLDPSLRPVATGETGEIYLGGVCLARGYLGAPAATAERFVPSPFVAGARLYRTGDLARSSEDGSLEYIGRTDDQVKVRGFRVELGEIEAALLRLQGVREAVAVARDDANGTKQLVAYIVGDAEHVRASLAQKLPAYAIPAAIVRLTALPLTERGKVDRRALPAPDFSAISGEYVAPRSALEERLAASFAELLALPRVGVHDDFFAIGGQSLLATQLANRIRVDENVELRVRTIFDAPTVAALAARIESTREKAVIAITRVARGDDLEPSFAQERLWFLDQLDPDKATYNVPLLLRLRGPLDATRLATSIAALVARHEALRTRFAAVDGRPRQVIEDALDVPLRVVAAETDADERAALADETERPFDLARGPLVRALVVRRSEREHVLAIVMHHIITDGWSVYVMARDLANIYAGRASALKPLAIHYADYAAWQRDWLAAGVGDQQLRAWKEMLAGAPAALELPTDRPRPIVRSQRGGRVAFEITGATATGVSTLARQERATNFMVLFAAYAALLARYAGQDDVVVGVPTASRSLAETEDLVGFFVNSLPLRTRLDGRPSFRELVARVRGSALGAYANQDVPFERIVEAVNPVRDQSRTPIFQVMFAYQPAGERDAFVVPGLEVEAVAEQRQTAKVDLILFVSETAHGFEATLEYDADLFDPESAQRLADSYETLSKAIVAAPRAASLSVSSASRSRGQGHCPSRARDASSISTTRTGKSARQGRGSAA